eukprot:TRINITY_DN30111_c0_g1_i1.p2 TRINITY_DN30111_c0_g1~~TRINITY_DN30111_c0_g1_i1.p2  ORF type:complete len:174 (-),score=35.97 TRINITY_DN30111_c0_g1_i1:71-592(-)
MPVGAAISLFAPRVVPRGMCISDQELDSLRGLHSYSLSVELRSPGHAKVGSIWREMFSGLVWDKQLSSWDKACFPLIKEGDFAPSLDINGEPSLRWQSIAFSGVVPYLVAADVLLVDEVSGKIIWETSQAVSYTHLRAHETPEHLVCRLLLEKKKTEKKTTQQNQSNEKGSIQ